SSGGIAGAGRSDGAPHGAAPISRRCRPACYPGSAQKRVFLETYGCQMNVADSETMAGVLERAGMTLVARADDADAILLNTCAIREHAELRVLGRLGEFARIKASRPEVVVGVAGCMAQHLRSRLL